MNRSTTRLLRLLAPLLAMALLLAACGGDDGAETPSADPTTPAADASSDAMTESEPMSETAGESEPMTESEAMSESEAMTESEPMSETAGETEAAAAAPVLDITATMADGSSVTLADYAGQPVFVETFATWCSNCRRQLGDTQAAAAEAGDEAVFLALSVESDLDPARLDGYAADNGFSDVTFAVLTDESLATLAGQFGNGVLVPPSTPKFTVGTDGAISELTTGYESVEEILGQLDTAA